MSPLTIAILSASDIAGGAEAYTVALARGLTGRGHDVALYGRCPGWEEEGLPCHPLAFGPKWSRKTIARGVLRVPLERRLVRDVADPSLSYMQFKREQIALTRPMSCKAPVVWAEHGRWMGGAMGRLLLGAYGRASQHVTKVICDSDAVASDLRRVVDPNKLVVIPNAIDTKRYAPGSADGRAARREQLMPDHLHERTVGVVAARLHPDKRHERAIAAALASGSALLVLGDGPARDELDRLAGGHPDIVFLGHRGNVGEYLVASDYYIYCGSPTEGMPTSILEAAACGLPIVAFHGDPCLELVQRCGGMVFTDPADFTADKVPALLDRRDVGVDYVARHHSHNGWLDACESVFRECSA